MSIFLVGGLYGSLKVPDIIQAVEDPDDIYTVCNGFLNKVLYHIICIVIVSEDVLSTEKHLKLGIFDLITQFTKSLPRILLEESQAGIKCSTAPALNSVISDFIELLCDRQHLLSRHTGRDQRLMRITQYGLRDLHWFLLYISHNLSPF